MKNIILLSREDACILTSSFSLCKVKHKFCNLQTFLNKISNYWIGLNIR